MDDWEVLKSAEAIFQTYESVGGVAIYRTALVLRQDPDRPIEVDGRRPPFAVFLVRAATQGRQKNSVIYRPHTDASAAARDAVEWLGEAREVPPEKVPATVLIGVANVMRDPSLLARYAPGAAE